MATSIFSDPFLALGLLTAGAAAVVLLWYLVRRPALTRATKLALLFGIGLLPIATAGNGNIAGYEATKERQFCSSCHVMTPYGDDAASEASRSLASRHSRNAAFGHESCYTCHADYGMFGTVATKLGGLRHVYEYVRNYRSMPVDEFLATIEIRQPFPNATCIRCHSTVNPGWTAIGDHASALDEVRAGTIACTSEGCHGPAHPFSKEARRERDARKRRAAP
jgi:NapC/NirT cytochrome c family, N-terminal region